MIAPDKPNPFRVLMLPIDATLAEIVSQGENLHLVAATREEEMLIRWATEQVRTNPRTRLAYELFELPDTQYDDEAWENFTRRHRRREQDLDTLAKDAPVPGLEDLDLAALTGLLLEDVLTIGEANLDQAIDGAPHVPRYTLPLEEGDVICG
jgi:hypothetical protein